MAKEEEKTPKIAKARYWWAVLYQENMRPDWRETIDDLLQLPYAYCEHTADKDSKSEHRKDHVHIIVAKSNTTSHKHIMEVFNLLSAPGKKALNTCEACVNIRHCYDYLIHDTDSCRKQGKEQYDPSRRITGNNFDIGAYEQISSAQKQEMLKELVGYIIANGFTTINDFTVAAMNDFDGCYWEIIVGYNGTLERYCRGNYLKRKAKIETLEGARDKAKHGAMTAKRELDGLEQLRVESHVKLGAVTAKVDEKQAQAAEIDRRIAEKMAELDRLDGEIGEKIELRNEVGDSLQREQRRLESVRQAAGRLEEDVEELEAIASLADRFDHAGRFEKRGILDEIAARCDGLRGRVEQVVEGIRGAVGRLEVAIEDIARKLAPRSARMTTRALKRDLAALEKDMSPVTLASEARDAARASNARRGNVPQRAADAWNRDHAAPQRTYRGRAR